MKKVLLIVFVVITQILLNAQTTLQTVDFETDGAGYSVSPAESNANTSNPDYWIRTNGTSPAIYPSVAFTNMQGSYFFTGEDLDFDSGVTKFYVTCNSVAVNGYDNLQLKILVGGAGSGYSKEGEEYLKIQYQYDGGGYTTLSQFLGNGNYYTEDADVNGSPDSPDDGSLDATDIGTSMKEFTYSIPNSGNNLQIRIEMYNGGSEELAFDNIRVLGTEALPVELTSFTARFDKLDEQQNCVVLNWQTATEVNNYGFAVERKPETGDWKEVGFVEGAGNSNSVKSYSFKDLNLTLNHNLTLTYRLKQIDLDGKFTYSKEIEVSTENIPSEFALEQNYPNPFNPVTTIKYSIPVGANDYSSVRLIVYNLLGQKVATLVNKQQAAGNYEVKFDASNLSSGIYLYKLQAGDFSSVKKLMLLK